MRWIMGLLVVLALLTGTAPDVAGDARIAAVPVSTAAVSGPSGEATCEECREIVSDCPAPSCKMPGVFEGRVEAEPAHPVRIGARMAGDTRASGLVPSPVPPPPRG